MSDETLAQLIALAACLLLIAVLIALPRRKRTVATQEITFTLAGAQRTLSAGDAVPAGATGVPAGATKEHRRSLLGGIVIGKDNRWSTSKSVAFAWTMVIAYGLLALLAAWVLGDETGWDQQVKDGLGDDYLVALGGTYAAAVLAKVKAVGQDDAGKTTAQPGQEKPVQLITDDEGQTALGDFQYVLFNGIAIVCFLVLFTNHLEFGFPDLPDFLAGLALTSAGGYSAAKLVGQTRPTLTSVLPAAGAVNAPIKVYGQNLVVPASVAPGGADVLPTVAVGGKEVDPTAHARILGADVLTVPVPAGATPGVGTVTVVRADGAAAVGPAGSDGIAFTVT